MNLQMITSSLFPQDDTGTPRWSDSGQYQFRILYNGSYRRVSSRPQRTCQAADFVTQWDPWADQ